MNLLLLKDCMIRPDTLKLAAVSTIVIVRGKQKNSLPDKSRQNKAGRGMEHCLR